MTGEVDLLSIERGLVVAPAGCGKTHAITEALRRHDGAKPVLVLTHTNSGVAALRQRLVRFGVPRGRYRLATIDGWAMRLVSMFPARAGYGDGPVPNKPNYLKIRKKTWGLLQAGHITNLLKASYSRLIVDEYQDCSRNQHGIVFFIAHHLPTVVLGDQMQAIFDFDARDPLADWEKHVRKFFPAAGNFDTPWRWNNVGNEQLGRWLLDARAALLERRPIDIGDAPDCVRWVQLNGDGGDHDALVAAAQCRHRQRCEKSLVIGNSRSQESRFRIARRVPGIVTIEPVSLQAVADFAAALDLGDGHEVGDTLRFAGSVMTNIDHETTVRRVSSLKAGIAKNAADDLEATALDLDIAPSFDGVARLLSECTKRTESRTYRQPVLRACFRALQMSGSDPSLSFEEAAVRVREENRAVGRQLPASAIGSTLLLKGLEADHVVVLNAGDLDAKNLYVAITRGAKSVTVCAPSSTLSPGLC